MGPVSALLSDAAASQRLVIDALASVEDEIQTWDGFAGRSVRFGYAAVQRLRPSFIDDNIDRLLPDMARIVDPATERGIRQGSVSASITEDAAPIAHRIILLIGRSAGLTTNRAVISIVDRLRPAGKDMIERIVPTLGIVLERHVDPPPPPRPASLADFLNGEINAQVGDDA